jgi:hypothetical protein
LKESGRIELVAEIGASSAVAELGGPSIPELVAFVVHDAEPSSATVVRILRTARLRSPA